MIVTLLLAAGASRRMGRPKLSLDLGGQSVVERAVDLYLSAPVDLVLVVVPPGGLAPLASRRDPRLRQVENPRPQEGMASSIRTGLAPLGPETRAVLLALADMPLVRRETVSAILRGFERQRAELVYPTFRGGRGHPVLFAAPLFVELAGLEGDFGARALLARHAARALAVEVNDSGVVFDLDTPVEYERAVRCWREENSWR